MAESIEELKNQIQDDTQLLTDLGKEMDVLDRLEDLAETSPIFDEEEAQMLMAMIACRRIDTVAAQRETTTSRQHYENRLAELEAAQ